jgi:hypothetical protein
MFQDSSGNSKLKIAFDYDDTLTDPLLFAFASRLINKGHDVWIITSRVCYESYVENCRSIGVMPLSETSRNQDLRKMSQRLGVQNKILYTDGHSKVEFFNQYGFDLLFDDEAELQCNPICNGGGLAVNV